MEVALGLRVQKLMSLVRTVISFWRWVLLELSERRAWG